jgi:peptidoglycan/LPS O-acetylase OafA/YrhL
MSGQKRDVQWADVSFPLTLPEPYKLLSVFKRLKIAFANLPFQQGIRGIACLQVVIAHGYEAFGWPETSFDRPYIFQIPFTRLILDGGYLAVCIFFVLSGYVCSIKPLKLSQSGKPEEARKVIASSAFRRLIRLGIPATIATTCSWFLCQMGGFNLSLSLPGYVWLNFHSARPTDWITSVRSLFHAIVLPSLQSKL